MFVKLSQLVNGDLQQTETEAVSFDDYYDVIVVGLGTAGSLAALAAARWGCSVLGIEALHCMGGTHSAGAIQNYYFGSPGGYFEEIDEQIRQKEHCGYPVWGGSSGELKKYFLEQTALELGISVRYESSVTAVYLDEKRAAGLRWFSPQGIHLTGAKVIIDATSNADICAMAGCETRRGRAIDGQGQPFSNVMEIAARNRVSKFYTDSGYVNPADAQDVTRAIIDSSILPPQLQDRYDGEKRMLRLTPLLGIREGRFIAGEKQVTLEAFQNDALGETPLFYAYSNLDNHSKDVAFESTFVQDWIVGASLWGLNFSVPVSAGALIPKDYEGLLAAGRCIALDHDISACVRMNRDMQKCGEAAGVMAGIAVKENCSLQQIPYTMIASPLRESGCLNDGRLHFVDTSNPREEWDKSTFWLTGEEDIRAALSSDKPGIAIWSAKRAGSAITDSLQKWIQQDSSLLLRKNSAIVLGLQGDEAALPMLREMARTRDSYTPKTSRKYNQPHGITAIYLLGKLADAEIFPDLLHILEDRDAFKNSPTDGEFIVDDEDFYAQYFMLSFMSLLRIADKHSHLRISLLDSLQRIVTQPDFSLSVTLKGSHQLRHSLKQTLKQAIDQYAQSWAISQ